MESTNPNENQEKKELTISVKTLTFVIIIILQAAVIGYFLWERNKSNQVAEIATVDRCERSKEEIKNTVEKIYFNITSGAWSSNNANPEDIPMYNFNIVELSKLTMAVGMVEMFSAFSDSKSKKKFSAEPFNINVSNCDSDFANVSYILKVDFYGDKKTDTINLIAKKIGGQWKIDGSKALVLDEKKK